MKTKSIARAGLISAALLLTGANAYAASQTMDKIKSSGTVTMGVRESSIPMSYTTGDSRFDGYHVEICRMILGGIKDKLGMNTLRINYQPVTSQNRVPLVQNGTVDIECGTTTNNVSRAKDVGFANTLYVEEVRIAVKANSGINSISQLAGKKVATTTGTTSVQLLRKHEKANGVNFDEVFGKDHADSFLLLESGRADAFVMDGSILAGNIANSKNPKESPSNRFLVHFSTAWVELFRNIPILVQVFLWYHVIPALIPALKAFPSYLLVSIALGFFTSARIAEQVRAGIQSLPSGQKAAATALGLTTYQSYRYIILPMALRIVIPPLTSESMNLIKNSSVAFAVSVPELTLFAMQAQEETSHGVEIYLAVTLLYALSAFAVNRVMTYIEKRSRIPGFIAPTSEAAAH
jgi:glutamate/aspartate transport system substrate-binding protein